MNVTASDYKAPGWSWFVFATLLAIRFTWNVTEAISVRLEPDWFFPLFAGWSGYRYGPRIVRLLLWSGVLALIAITINPTPWIWVSVGFGPDSYLLALAAAVAFAQPKGSLSGDELFRSRWRGAVWIALLGLAFGAFLNGSLQLTFRERFQIQANPGVPLAVAILAGWLNWSLVVSKARSAWGLVGNPFSKILAVTLTAIALPTLLANLDFSVGESVRFNLNAGLSYPSHLLLALCFLLPASGMRNRRFGFGMLAVLGGGVLIAWLVAPSWTRAQAAFGQAVEVLPKQASRSTVNWGLLVDCMSAVLLGSVLSPFWLRQTIGPLRSRWTPMVLGIVLVAEFVAIPLVREGGVSLYGFTTWILGALAFVAGLIWRGKGAFIAPLFIQLCCLASQVGFPADSNPVSLDMNLRLALITFPFAFFGLLSNRYDRTPTSALTTSSELFRERPESGASTVDITPLSRVVRRLDVSATLKTFAAVMFPLVVLHNLAALSLGVRIAASLRDEFSFSEDFAVIGALGVVAILLVLAPFGFLVADWVTRKDSWRYLSAITGALLGGIGFAGLGALPPLILAEVDREALRPGIVGAALVLLVGLGTWLLARSRIVRLTLLGITILAALAAAGAVAVLVGNRIAGRQLASNEEWSGLALGLILLVSGIWWLVRAVRLRVVLSGDRPRALLLGDLHRTGFLVRLAFLMGLPASLWNRAALRTPPFWCFLGSRGLVFVGFQLLLTDVYAGYGGDFWILTGKARLATGVILILAGHAVFYLGKRLATRSAWIPGSTADSRPPVLFLRSFEDDQFTFKRPAWDLVGRWFDLWSFRRNADETLIDEAAQYGPVVALGRPGEKQVPFGARRYYSSHQDWQAIVTETARRARAVVICAGATSGVIWEYDLLAKERLLDRTILLFRPTRDGSSNREAINAFQSATSARLDFDATNPGNWVALLTTGNGPTLLEADQPTAAAYLLALRAHFQRRTPAELADRALV